VRIPKAQIDRELAATKEILRFLKNSVFDDLSIDKMGNESLGSPEPERNKND